MEEAIVISPLDEMMETALVKANVTDAVISNLKSKYGELKLRSVDDKEKYLEIKDAKKDCAKLRNLAVRICKEGRDDANKISKKWVAKEKEVVGKIDEVESPLDAEIDRFDAEVKRKEEEEKQRQETQYMRRTQALTKMGALYSDNSFVLGDFSLEANLVKESSQEVWDDEILPKFNEQFFILEAERIEQERIKAEKEAELKRQQEELLQKQREFEAQQAEFKRKQEESEREKLAEQNKIQQDRYSKIVQYSNVGERLDMNNLWALGQSDFEEKLVAKQKAFQEWESARQKQIEEAAAQRERERIAQEQAQEESKRRIEEQKKAEELAKAGDKAIWADFIQKVEKIEHPKLKSGQYKKIGNIAIEKLNEILALKPYQ
jgi:unconventional prefoldin RPB5 interactor 1